MKDFKDFERENEEARLNDGENREFIKPDGNALKTFAALASRYEGKSGDEIMKAIIEEAERSRKKGTLSDKDIDDFVGAISPMLSGKQKMMLKGVVAKIKKE
ncbi:MAG: hypothetical protein IJ800_04280 [Clostridia bacterium]|nr:hypothetical protein [Clostridia bacterium]